MNANVRPTTDDLQRGLVLNNPNYVPPSHELLQYIGIPAPKFMPVTFFGLAIIQRFEESLFKNIRQDEKTQGKWRGIFNSVKGRCLHGATSSQLPGGESPEEQTIMKHIKEYVQRHKNPAFEGFEKAPRTIDDLPWHCPQCCPRCILERWRMRNGL